MVGIDEESYAKNFFSLSNFSLLMASPTACTESDSRRIKSSEEYSFHHSKEVMDKNHTLTAFFAFQDLKNRGEVVTSTSVHYSQPPTRMESSTSEALPDTATNYLIPEQNYYLGIYLTLVGKYHAIENLSLSLMTHYLFSGYLYYGQHVGHHCHVSAERKV